MPKPEAILVERVTDALIATGRLEPEADTETFKAAVYKLLDDFADGELPTIFNESEPLDTVEEAVHALLGAFADKVLGRVN